MSKSSEEKRDIPQFCEFCEHAVIINDEENVLCSKKGIIGKKQKCRKYVYDPLKRVPRQLPEIPKLSKDDIL